MGYYDADVYNQPEVFGLTQIASINDPNASYSFDLLVVWQHEDGRVFWLRDSGCSCPSPFESATSLENCNLITGDTWDEFQETVEQHCLPYDDSSDLNAAEKTTMLQKVSELVTPSSWEDLY